jgi:hypothetical protein
LTGLEGLVKPGELRPQNLIEEPFGLRFDVGRIYEFLPRVSGASMTAMIVTTHMQITKSATGVALA